MRDVENGRSKTHLASIAYLRQRGHAVTLATYDTRVRDAANDMGVALWSAEGDA